MIKRTAVGYAPHGAIQQITYAAGRYEQTCYNSRLQVQTILLRTAAPTGQCTDTTNNLWKLGLDYGTSNNGNLMGAAILDGVSWTVSQSFTYDKLNRLSSAEEPAVGSGLSWKRTFGYDRWGNQWVDPTVANSYGIGLDTVTPNGSTWITAKNRLNLPRGSYDRAGNLLAISGSGATYDAENRLTAVGTVQDSYDGEGRRVKKVSGSATTQYVYDAMGQLAAEYTTGAVPVASCRTCYLVEDQLGSTRALWDTTGVRARYDYMPFGELIPAERNGRSGVSCAAGATSCYGGESALTMRFTGKERDADTANSGMSTGLDYFGARYFSAAQGRFTSPDWSAVPQPVPYADLTDPQTLNLYSYVRNNPLSRTDPDGHCCEEVEDFGRQVTMAAPHPLFKLGGYLIIGAGIVGTALTSPDVRAAAADFLTYASEHGGKSAAQQDMDDLSGKTKSWMTEKQTQHLGWRCRTLTLLSRKLI